MDTRTGEIAHLDHFLRSFPPAEVQQFVRPVELSGLSPRVRADLARTGLSQVGRNSPCPCQSGRKFKRCCMHPGTQQFV